MKTVCVNKRAKFDYALDKPLEAGLVLKGSEVKSMRVGKVSIAESYIVENKGELFLFNANISEYSKAGIYGHSPKRERKLLLHKKEINKLIGAMRKDGFTLVPLSIYFNNKGLAKISISLAKGKKVFDKRAAIKEREWNRDKQRLLKV